jgi:hypothetical protein
MPVSVPIPFFAASISPSLDINWAFATIRLIVDCDASFGATSTHRILLPLLLILFILSACL